MKRENCGMPIKLIKLGIDDTNEMVFECPECGSICYEDGTLVEEDYDITIVKRC